MNKYKICVYAISKNEEKFVDRWMTAVKEADMVIVTDTGSKDSTVQKLREAGAVVFEEKIIPWRFDTARNIAMSHIPDDIDICVSNDLDEIFELGWREKLEKAWTPECTRARYLFTWSHFPDGKPDKQFPMEKIHRRHDFQWVHPVHEILEYNGKDKEYSVWVNGLILNHYPDLSKPRGQYLPLLELSVKENPQDDRTVFWLGREYMYNGKYDLCIETLKKHLSLPTAKWAEERSASMRFIASSYQAKGNIQEAKAWAFRAIAEYPYVREPYLKMARLACAESNWSLTYAMVKKGLAISQKSGSYLIEPESWGFALFDLGAISTYYLGLYQESHEYAVKALEFDSSDKRLKDNLKMIEDTINFFTYH